MSSVGELLPEIGTETAFFSKFSEEVSCSGAVLMAGDVSNMVMLSSGHVRHVMSEQSNGSAMK